MKKIAFILLMLAAAGLFTSLGVWQLNRLAWKRDLIAHAEHNLAAPPVAAPLPAAWPALNRAAAYTRVRVQGQYLPGKDTLVHASTRYGRGFWVLTPLQTTTSFTVLINRGFITPEQQATLTTPPGTVTVNGLLRLSEPHGSLLQTNNPQQQRWYARDVQAIATRQNLTNPAPYFIDAAADNPSPPIAGLTVINFPNHHLQYALTWFALALLALLGLRPILKNQL